MQLPDPDIVNLAGETTEVPALLESHRCVDAINEETGIISTFLDALQSLKPSDDASVLAVEPLPSSWTHDLTCLASGNTNFSNQALLKSYIINSWCMQQMASLTQASSNAVADL